MVRRDADNSRAVGPRSARGISPAGGSPVPVSAGAPGSRPHVGGGDPSARAGRRRPVRQRELRSGEQARGPQARGPQHEVKPAASTEEQSEGRAAHVTAKVTLDAPVPERVSSLGGVRGAARVQGEVLNSGDPSAQPPSRQARPYESMTKSGRAQRESEGIVVLETGAKASGTNVVKKNAAGGKGPRFDRVEEAGKREGMTGKTGSNDPGGRRPRDKVRELQRRLWIAAKRNPGRRFHALYDHISSSDVLLEAWKRVRKNKGSAGVDRVALVEIEQCGVERSSSSSARV